jgi:hypothetical protein
MNMGDSLPLILQQAAPLLCSRTDHTDIARYPTDNDLPLSLSLYAVNSAVMVVVVRVVSCQEGSEFRIPVLEYYVVSTYE